MKFKILLLIKILFLVNIYYSDNIGVLFASIKKDISSAKSDIVKYKKIEFTECVKIKYITTDITDDSKEETLKIITNYLSELNDPNELYLTWEMTDFIMKQNFNLKLIKNENIKNTVIVKIITNFFKMFFRNNNEIKSLVNLINSKSWTDISNDNNFKEYSLFIQNNHTYFLLYIFENNYLYFSTIHKDLETYILGNSNKYINEKELNVEYYYKTIYLNIIKNKQYNNFIYFNFLKSNEIDTSIVEVFINNSGFYTKFVAYVNNNKNDLIGKICFNKSFKSKMNDNIISMLDKEIFNYLYTHSNYSNLLKTLNNKILIHEKINDKNISMLEQYIKEEIRKLNSNSYITIYNNLGLSFFKNILENYYVNTKEYKEFIKNIEDHLITEFIYKYDEILSITEPQKLKPHKLNMDNMLKKMNYENIKIDSDLFKILLYKSITTNSIGLKLKTINYDIISIHSVLSDFHKIYDNLSKNNLLSISEEDYYYIFKTIFENIIVLKINIKHDNRLITVRDDLVLLEAITQYRIENKNFNSNIEDILSKLKQEKLSNINEHVLNLVNKLYDILLVIYNKEIKVSELNLKNIIEDKLKEIRRKEEEKELKMKQEVMRKLEEDKRKLELEKQKVEQELKKYDSNHSSSTLNSSKNTDSTLSSNSNYKNGYINYGESSNTANNNQSDYSNSIQNNYSKQYQPVSSTTQYPEGNNYNNYSNPNPQSYAKTNSQSTHINNSNHQYNTNVVKPVMPSANANYQQYYGNGNGNGNGSGYVTSGSNNNSYQSSSSSNTQYQNISQNGNIITIRKLTKMQVTITYEIEEIETIILDGYNDLKKAEILAQLGENK